MTNINMPMTEHRNITYNMLLLTDIRFEAKYRVEHQSCRVISTHNIYFIYSDHVGMQATNHHLTYFTPKALNQIAQDHYLFFEVAFTN